MSETVHLARLAVSVLSGVAFLLAVGGNVHTILRYYLRGERGSLVPLVGGVFGSLALVAWPMERLWHWFWVPLVVDPGTLPMVLWAALSFFVRKHPNAS